MTAIPAPHSTHRVISAVRFDCGLAGICFESSLSERVGSLVQQNGHLATIGQQIRVHIDYGLPIDAAGRLSHPDAGPWMIIHRNKQLVD